MRPDRRGSHPLFSRCGAALRARRRLSTIRLTNVRPHKGRLLIRIEGVEDADAAESFVGAVLTRSRDQIPLREGEYLDNDLVGCSVQAKMAGITER